MKPSTTAKILIKIHGKIEMVDGNNSGLHINKPVYAIHLADIREEKHGMETRA